MPFTHLDRDGNAHMVDVGDKSASRREATASARVRFPPDVYAALRESGGETRKGSITATAQIAGIMAAKQTANLIPLCHPLPLDKVALEFAYDDTACALTIYDMCKALSHDIIIESVRLQGKSGGKRDFNRETGAQP